jgi:hypothetical protein
LHRALERHHRLVDDDVTAALVEHVRSSIMYERQLLRELEALRPDVNSAADKNVPKANGAPRPTIILPLDDVRVPKPQLPAAAVHHTSTTAQAPPFVSGITTNSKQESSSFQPPGGPSHSRTPSAAESSTYPAPAPAANDPLLGGRPVDGTKSMFINPPLSTPPTAVQQQQTHDPLMSSHPHPLSRSHSVSAAEPSITSNGNASVTGPARGGLDPLGQAKPTSMSASMRVQPSRPRLDAREAASKLANMF